MSTIKKILIGITALALVAVLVILIRADRNDAPVSLANTNVSATQEPIRLDSHYHIAVLSDAENLPLTRLDSDALPMPIYAVTDTDGAVWLLVYAYEEGSGEYGFLLADVQAQGVQVREESGFVELPAPAQGTTAGTSEYAPLAKASVNGGEAQFYYPADENGGMRDGAIPVTVGTLDGVFGAYYFLNGTQPVLVTALGEQSTPEPTDEPEQTVAPEETPTASEEPEQSTMPSAEATVEPSATATATPTATPRRTHRATAKPTATPTATPTAAPTAVPTSRPTAKPTAAPTAKPTNEPTAAPTATPTSAPTATPEPTAAPTATPTPKPTEEPKPHYEWRCRICHKTFKDESSCLADQAEHVAKGEGSGKDYDKIWVVP